MLRDFWSSCWGLSGEYHWILWVVLCAVLNRWGRVVMMKVMMVMLIIWLSLSLCFHLRIGIILKILDSSHRMVHFIILQFPAVLCCILVFNLPWTPNSYGLFIIVSHLWTANLFLRLIATNRSYKGSTFSRKKTGTKPHLMTWLRGALCVSCAVMATRLYSSCFVQATSGGTVLFLCVFFGGVDGNEFVEFGWIWIKLVDHIKSVIPRQQQETSCPGWYSMV